MLSILARLFSAAASNPVKGHGPDEGFCPLEHLDRGLDAKLVELETIRKDLFTLKGRLIRKLADDNAVAVESKKASELEAKKVTLPLLASAVAQIDKTIADTKEIIKLNVEKLSHEAKSAQEALEQCEAAVNMTYPLYDSIYCIKMILLAEKEKKEFGQEARRELASLILQKILLVTDMFPHGPIENAHKKVFEAIRAEISVIDNFIFDQFELLKTTRTRLSNSFARGVLSENEKPEGVVAAGNGLRGAAPASVLRSGHGFKFVETRDAETQTEESSLSVTKLV